jgi:hypothetical protein
LPRVSAFTWQCCPVRRAARHHTARDPTPFTPSRSP